MVSKAGNVMHLSACPFRMASTRSNASSAAVEASRDTPLGSLSGYHLADEGIPSLIQQSVVPERPGQRLHQRRVRTSYDSRQV